MSDSRDPSVGPSDSSGRTKSSKASRSGYSAKTHSSSHGKEKFQHNTHVKRHSKGPHRHKTEWRENRSPFQRQDSSSSQGKKECTLVESSQARPQLKDGKKKASQSLNHLLNFTLTPRESSSWGGGGQGRYGRSYRSYHHFNKEQFLQANCQFVVKASRDYSVHLADPDTLVEWDCVEQVRLFCDEMPCCPICLYPPRAAKITQCGHVFCWSCILHYLTLGEREWRKCPICYESIYRNNLKSVVAVSSKVYSVGDTITMNLMKRPKNGTMVLPKSEWSKDHGHQLLPLDAPETTNSVKLLSATPVQVLGGIVSEEKCALEHQLKSLSPDEESEKCFVEAAIADLEEREAELLQSKDIAEDVVKFVEETSMEGKVTDCDNQSSVSTTDDEYSSSWNTANMVEASFDTPFTDDEDDSGDIGDGGSDSGDVGDGSSDSGENELSKTTLEEPPTDGTSTLLTPALPLNPEESMGQEDSDQLFKSAHAKQDGNRCTITEVVPQSEVQNPSVSEFVYFFQSADGQHLYLHPVNARCLMREFESLEYAPEHVKARIVDIEQFTITEATRSRFRYLRHLPLTCHFALCELDLKPPLLSKATLQEYEADLKKRQQKRLKKKQEDRKKEKDSERTFIQKDVLNLSSKQPSEISPEQFHDLLSLASSPPLPTPSVVRSLPLETGENGGQVDKKASSQQDNSSSSTTSFAAALMCPSKSVPPPVWPGKNVSLKKSTSSLPAKQTPTTNTVSAETTKIVNSDGEEEEISTVPSFQDAFGLSLSAAFENVRDASIDKSGKPGGSKTAKKGKKKIVLFTTSNMRRGV